MNFNINSSTKRRLLSNFFSLSSIQIFSYILPIITVPYLVHVLKAEKFGLIVFAQTIIGYFVIFVDYGFGLSATKQIAENRENKEKISEIFSSVLLIKMFMLLFSFIILSVFIFSFEKFAKDWEIYYFTFGIVIGQAIFPVWYFQGIEKMKIVALANIIPKIIFTVLIFLFVKEEKDYLYVPIINSLGFLFAGVISLGIAIKYFKVSFIIPSIKQIKYQLLEGWHIFLGIISANFTILNTPFILGVLTNSTIVGYYAAVEKIIRPLTSLNRPIINAIFPYLSHTAKTNPKKVHSLSKKVSLIVAGIMFLIGIILFVFSDQIVTFIFGNQFYKSSTVLKIMAFIPMLHSLIHIYCVPNMIIFDLKRIYSKILFFSFILSILLSFIMIKLLLLNGASLSVLLIDIIIFFSMFFAIKKYLNIK